MSQDLTVSPWNRLTKLSPPGTAPADIQRAADEHALTGDMYAACADLWEEKATSLQAQAAFTSPQITSASQDGVSVNYVDPIAQITAQSAAAWQMARKMRSKAKATSPLIHDPADTPWLHRTSDDWLDWATSSNDSFDGPVIPTTDV